MIRTVAALMALALAPLAFAVPTTLTHQGRITDADGTPQNVSSSVTFTLYTHPTDDSSDVWSETHPSVAVQDGYYSVALGSVDNTLDEAFLGAGTLYLGVTVGTDAELLPRTELRSVPYALRAGVADNAAGTGTTVVDLIDGATIGVDADGADAFEVTIAGERTLANPTNLVNGKEYTFIVHQDAVGGHALSFASAYQFATVPNLSTAANGTVVLQFVAVGSSLLMVNGYLGQCPVGERTFTYTGEDVPFVVPEGCNSVEVKLWGAGGGGGGAGAPTYPNATGGGGGFASADLSVTPGEALTIIVGGGGHAPNVSPFSAYGGGGIGCGNTCTNYAGGGGGRSAIRRGSAELITAGAGGAGHFGDPGGAGGGAVGQDGSTPNYYLGDNAKGRGGTQTAGGAAGTCNSGCGGSGSAFQGGSRVSATYVGGGGSGWFGGAAGGTLGSTHDGGGGGSSYVPAGGFTIGGNNQAAGNTADPDYPAGAAVGGAPNSAGSPGVVVVKWGG